MEKYHREAKQQTPLKTEGAQRDERQMCGHLGVLVLGVAVRKDSLKAFAAVDDPNATHIYAFFFHQERHPTTHVPIQLGLPTPSILSKLSADSGITVSNLTVTHLWALLLAQLLLSSWCCLCSASFDGIQLPVSKYPWIQLPREPPLLNGVSCSENEG